MEQNSVITKNGKTVKFSKPLERKLLGMCWTLVSKVDGVTTHIVGKSFTASPDDYTVVVTRNSVAVWPADEK